MTNPVEADKGVAAIPPFGLRMRPELKRRVEEAARANNRSLNSEIVARLEQSFREESRPTIFSGQPSLSDHEGRLSALEGIVDLLMTEDVELSKRLKIVETHLKEQTT
jgi:Arc-like DNA binding dprotein